MAAQVVAIDDLKPNKQDPDVKRKNLVDWLHFPNPSTISGLSVLDRGSPISSRITSIEFSPDGQLIAVVSNQMAHLWSWTDDRLVQAIPANAIGFSPAGDRFVTCEPNGTTSIRRLIDGSHLSVINTKASMAKFSHDGREIFLCHYDEIRRISLDNDRPILQAFPARPYEVGNARVFLSSAAPYFGAFWQGSKDFRIWQRNR